MKLLLCLLVAAVAVDASWVPHHYQSVYAPSYTGTCSPPCAIPYRVPHPYKYGYAVDQPSKKLRFSKNEESRDGKTEGSYSVLLPDGRTQKVTYYVEGDSGFQAKVTYDKEAKYDWQPEPSKPICKSPGCWQPEPSKPICNSPSCEPSKPICQSPGCVKPEPSKPICKSPGCVKPCESKLCEALVQPVWNIPSAVKGPALHQPVWNSPSKPVWSGLGWSAGRWDDDE